jgi:hypothetical protein
MPADLQDTEREFTAVCLDRDELRAMMRTAGSRRRWRG